jgi:hypothetical protein
MRVAACKEISPEKKNIKVAVYLSQPALQMLLSVSQGSIIAHTLFVMM